MLYIFQQLFNKEEYHGRATLLANFDTAFTDRLFVMALDGSPGQDTAGGIIEVMLQNNVEVKVEEHLAALVTYLRLGTRV